MVVQLPLVFDAERIHAHVANVLSALEHAGVERAVFNANSPLPPDEIGIPFVDGRVRLARLLGDSVPFAALVAPRFTYMENLAIPASAARIRERGEVAYPIPQHHPVPWVAMDDVAAVVAAVLDAEAPPVATLIAGPADLVGDEVAKSLASAVGRDVRWVTIDHVDYEAMLAADLGAEAAKGVASFYAAPPSAAGPSEPPGLVRGATTLERWAAATSARF